jgi:hypothetical protein
VVKTGNITETLQDLVIVKYAWCVHSAISDQNPWFGPKWPTKSLPALVVSCNLFLTQDTRLHFAAGKSLKHYRSFDKIFSAM